MKKKKLNFLTLQDLINSLDPKFLFSTPTVIQSKGSRHPKDILLSDFFGQSKTDINLLNVSILDNTVNGNIYDNNIHSDGSEDLKDEKNNFKSFYLSSESIHMMYIEEYIEPLSRYSNQKNEMKFTEFEYSDPIYVIMHIFVVISFIYLVLQFIV
jgi:glycosylphosphatidylinositol transamidase (GPIT) subunit GPI8